MIYNGYIIQYRNGYERTFGNQTQLTRELRMCRKSIYSGFERGYANVKDLSIQKVIKVRNGVVVGEFFNKEIEKYIEMFENASC